VIPAFGGHAVTPAPRTVTAQQKFDLLWQIITEMQREMHMHAMRSPATENGTQVVVGATKSECDSIPVHAPRDDARGMVKGLPKNGDANPTFMSGW